MTDPYAALGLGPSASDEELTKAYRRLAKRYHPDMNYGNKAAEARMQEINAAYDQIKNERSGGGYGGAYGGAGSGGSGAGSAGNYDPFGGFDWSGWFGGYNTGSTRGADSARDTGSARGEDSPRDADSPRGEGYGRREGPDWRSSESWYAGADRDAGDTDEAGSRSQRNARVRLFIRSGLYRQALELLLTAGFEERDAEWFYYSAYANAGAGNRVTALSHAREAVRLDPDNTDYRSLLYQLERGAQYYRQTGAAQGFDMRNLGRMLLQCLLSQLLCYCFCCRPC